MTGFLLKDKTFLFVLYSFANIFMNFSTIIFKNLQNRAKNLLISRKLFSQKRKLLLLFNPSRNFSDSKKLL
jgi:hypothetical protein